MKKYLIIVGLTFGIAFAATYVASGNQMAFTDWSIIQRCIAAGITAVMAWFITYATSLKAALEDVKDENQRIKEAILDLKK
jgi:hypothetical protein